ncbi:MAG: xanthan lyase [Tannerellaceae bacterium]|nr:xanthan lyase [Tannerellaceae bacterium]
MKGLKQIRQWLLFAGWFPVSLFAQQLPPEVQSGIEEYLTQIVNRHTYAPPVRIDSIAPDKKNLQLFANVHLSYMPFRKEEVEEIYQQVKERLPETYRRHTIRIYTDGYKIEDYIPFNRKDRIRNKVDRPLVVRSSRPYGIAKGLENRHIALWQSHGWYYEQKLSRWEWQRARIFQTVEDLYTQSYVLPYLVPMLENAGANVLLPRERDIQRHEVIVDNDRSTGRSLYEESAGKERWHTADWPGFAHTREWYADGENPFTAGTYRQISTVTRQAESTCSWIPDIPEKGTYGVYVSYQTVANSTDDARYTVYHAGGETHFSVNQQMGGGTWIFLGYFEFEQGRQGKVMLTNQSRRAGRTVTADAVKIGGGMGNIARQPHPDGELTGNLKSSEEGALQPVTRLPEIRYEPETSRYPRYTEAARYWLQWAGAPDSIYNRSEGKNDYMDDYQSRGFWVNYIAGGSSVLPQQAGLQIPVDLAFTFHTDAGTTETDSIIGTLGICMTHMNGEVFENGKSRLASRDLTDLIMEEIVQDIREKYEPDWTRRPIWNRSYSEARTPEVPTMLLELLSHQNLADMRYGLDPRFRFTVSRSIYKGMLKCMARQYGTPYVVQPLPVTAFSALFTGEKEVELTWQPVEDDREPTAKPEQYVVYTRIGAGGFDNGRLVQTNSVRLPIQPDQIYSYKVTAVNEGGESFPSEILSVCRVSQEKGQVLIVNGFDRLSAPFSFVTRDSIGGFVDAIDHGVPDRVEYHYIGSQYEFRRQIPWMDDDAPGFGASQGNYESTVLAGNTFDYPYMHGKAMQPHGYSFASCSQDAWTTGNIDVRPYPLIDLILGKQKQTSIGRGHHQPAFKTFPVPLQEKITEYCQQGGHLFVSGAYVASDLWDTPDPVEADQDFAWNLLRYTWRVDRAAVEGKVKSVTSPFSVLSGNYTYHSRLNPESYAVEAPDAIEPASENSFTVFRYSENNISAGVASVGDYNTLILGFPFETIQGASARNALMKNILQFMFPD